MTDYYQPSLLFRQNAMRRRYHPQLSPIMSNESLDSQISQLSLKGSQKSSNSWLLKDFNDSDLQLVNKSCALDRVNVTSNYWKVPDNTMYLTSMAIKRQAEEQDSEDVRIAIASGGSENNLFIYDLDIVDTYLTHQSTISLANIHSLQWVPQTDNLLITGNDKGYAHLVSIPESDSDESAEICKRFNHRKHMKTVNKPTNNDYYSHTSIKRMCLNNGNRELLTIYDTNLFHWDIHGAHTQLKPSPMLITPIPGLMNLEPMSNNAPHQIGICGKFGVSLLDLRDHKFSVPKRDLSVKEQHNFQCNMMRWKPHDANVFAGAHRDGVVRIWDIRKQGESVGNFSGHTGRVTSMEWNNGDLFTGGKDGNIIFWDLNGSNGSLKNCGVKQGLESVHFDPKTNTVDKVLNQTQCGTVLPASNTNVVGMTSIRQRKDGASVLSIDGSSYLGVHKRLEDVYDLELTLYYTKEELKLMKLSEVGTGGSSNTLVGGDHTGCEIDIELLECKPLQPIMNTDSVDMADIIDVDESLTFGLGHKNMSNDTLVSTTSSCYELLDPKVVLLQRQPLTSSSTYSDDDDDDDADKDTTQFMSPGSLVSDNTLDSIASPISVATEEANDNNGSIDTLDTLYSSEVQLHHKSNLLQSSTLDYSKFRLELDFELDTDDFDFGAPAIMA